MPREAINTDTAPAAIGTYSQAARHGGTVYLSGQIPLSPETGGLVDGDMATQIQQVFNNLAAVAAAAGGSLSDVVKLNVYLTDLSDFPTVSEVMPGFFSEPYPARAVVGVAALPKGANVEIDAVIELA
ncbi:MAG: Rid family detoxifying hydrolase [Gammaproteobacteria bacterium]|nr:Rid family detoxifying hydrolase [Gammaproteobacteria bacterium]